MRQKILACLLVMCFFQGSAPNAVAASQTIVIRTVQPYGFVTVNGVLSQTASHELIEIENTSDATINMTGWAVKYQSASGSTPKAIHSVSPATGMQFTMLASHARDTFVSTAYASSHMLVSSLSFSSTLADSGGNVMLFNSLGQEIDRVGWRVGSAQNGAAETDAVLLSSTTSTMQRVGPDTDNNAHDFRVLPTAEDPAYLFGGMYDVNDVCSNYDGIQEMPIAGTTAYDDGTCIPTDRCSNIDGEQIDVPEFYDRQASGECIEHDACSNMNGIQHVVPDSFELVDNTCVPKFVSKQIILTELLANPEGVDAGHEYIELYNASDETVNLADYSLYFSGKTVHFPAGKLFLSHSYISFSDDDLDITFPNAAGVEITVYGKDGTATSTMPAYSNAPASQSYSELGGKWVFTNVQTPGAENQPSLVAVAEEYESPGTTYAPCAANQYRSSETNRCRLIATNDPSLATCKEGQYRSEETNRCRSIVQTVAASLKPCGDDQFRNSSTGRCKKIASTDDFLQPCDAGWERNADTNRCRKIKATSLPVAAFPVQATAPSAHSLSTWAIGGAVIFGALGYAAWEWRHETGAMFKRIFMRRK